MTQHNVKRGWIIDSPKRANKDTFAIEPNVGDVPAVSVTCVAATNLFTSAAHGFKAGDTLSFSSMTGGAGISAGTLYYVLAAGLTANDFQVSTTPGGAPVDVTTDMTAGKVSKLTIGSRRFLSTGDAVPPAWVVPAADADNSTTVDVSVAT